MLEIPKDRFEATMVVASAKNKALPVGAVVTLLSRKQQEFTTGTKENPRTVINDILFVDIDGKRASLPMGEIHRFNFTPDSEKLVASEGETVQLRTKFKIVSSENRLNQSGEIMYVPAAYKRADEFFRDENRITYQELIASGPKKDHNYDPIQDYTIEVLS